jgi:hypothetical protein
MRRFISTGIPVLFNLVKGFFWHFYEVRNYISIAAYLKCKSLIDARRTKMQNHIKVVGWTYIVLGLIGALGAVLLFLVIAGGGLISGDETAFRITSIVGASLAAILLLVSSPGVLAGAGLLRHRPWARILALILALLNLPGFPVGTLLGIYTIWALLDNESVLIFNQN